MNFETDANEGSWSTYERGPFLVGLLCLLCRLNRFLSCLGCFSQFSTKYYFSHRTLFHFINPHRQATWAGSHAGSPIAVSLVETEANGDYCTNDRGPSLVGFVGLFVPVQNIFFLTAHFFILCVPVAQQPGQAVVPGRLSLNMCLGSWV
jgi:hypothetical protein